MAELKLTICSSKIKGFISGGMELELEAYRYACAVCRRWIEDYNTEHLVV